MQSATKILKIIQAVLIIAILNTCIIMSRELMQRVQIAKFFWLSCIMIILPGITTIKSATYPPHHTSSLL
jgi:hypothetical protein